MFRKRMIAIIIAIGMSGLVACAPTATSTQQESTTPQETTTVNNNESTSAEEGTSTEYDNTSDVYGRVDVEDICKHIMINGKQVDFPWTLNKLGEEYEFGFVADTDITDGICAANLMYNGELGISVMIIAEDEINRDSLIYSFSTNMNREVYLYDFNSETTMEMIERKLGVPNEIKEYEYEYYYVYKKEKIEMTFVFLKDEEVLDYFFVTIK